MHMNGSAENLVFASSLESFSITIVVFAAPTTMPSASAAHQLPYLLIFFLNRIATVQSSLLPIEHLLYPICHI